MRNITQLSYMLLLSLSLGVALLLFPAVGETGSDSSPAKALAKGSEARRPSAPSSSTAKASAHVAMPQTMSAAVGGKWEERVVGTSVTTLFPTKGVPVHISLLPDGRLLYWGRDKADDNYDVGGHSETYLVDPLYIDNPNYTVSNTNTTTNLFCSGHSFLPDGRLLVTGGHGKATDPIYPKWNSNYSWVEGVGEKHINIFDYRNNTWTRQVNREMEKGRWYPFHVTMANGETVIMSGTYWDGIETFGTGVNERPKIFNNTDVSVRDLQGNIRTLLADTTYDNTQFYPYLSLTPDNKVFNAKASPAADGSYGNRFLDPYAFNSSTGGFGVFTRIMRPTHDHWEGTSVMYEPGKVLVTGGGYAGFGGQPSNLAETIDLTKSAPQWNRETQAGNMTWGRQYPTATLLPDGKVLVTGGTNCSGYNQLNCGPNGTYGGAVQTPELWDPANPSQWQQMNATTSGVPRVYHSVAMLLPDARVLIGGGGLPAAAGEVTGNGITCTGEGPKDPKIDCRKLSHSNVEIFSPPYLFDANGNEAVRPSITSAPKYAAYGNPITIDVGNVTPGNIREVVLVRLPSVTHTYNQDQRLVRLGAPTGIVGDYSITVNGPADGNVCPPGPYMMFLISNDNRNTPSVARIIRVGGLSLGSAEQVFPLEGSSDNTLTVTANTGVSWTAEAESLGSWVTITCVNDTTRCPGAVKFNVSSNPGDTAVRREGIIRIGLVGSETDSIKYEFKIYQPGKFKDISGLNSLQRDSINRIYAREITIGRAIGEYQPAGNVNRAEMVTFLTRVLRGSNTPPAPRSQTFSDVPISYWAAPFVEYSARRGITSGIGGNQFGPELLTTREQMAVFLCRALGIKNPPPVPQNDPPFTDVRWDSPFAPYIAEIKRRGITAGCGGTSFCPGNPVSRADMAIFLVRAFGL